MKSVKKLMMAAMVGMMVLGTAGCGGNKAKEALGLPATVYCSGYKTLEKSVELIEQQDKLPSEKKSIAEDVETAANNKIRKEWIPQIQDKAKSLGIKSFSVDVDESTGVLLVPADAPRKFCGCLIGSAKADGDKVDFIVDIEVMVLQDGSVSYEFKK